MILTHKVRTKLKKKYRTSDTLDFLNFSGSWSKTYFVPVGCFVVFNIADYAGKQFAVWVQKPGPSKLGQISLLVATLLRLAFIPLFMFCNVSVNNRKTEVLIESDAAYILFMLVFGISNGYIGNIAMMFGPGTVKDQKYKARQF